MESLDLNICLSDLELRKVTSLLPVLLRSQVQVFRDSASTWTTPSLLSHSGSIQCPRVWLAFIQFEYKCLIRQRIWSCNKLVLLRFGSRCRSLGLIIDSTPAGVYLTAAFPKFPNVRVIVEALQPRLDQNQQIKSIKGDKRIINFSTFSEPCRDKTSKNTILRVTMETVTDENNQHTEKVNHKSI